MKATQGGGILTPLDQSKAYINIKGTVIPFYALPDLSDSKSASYADEPVIGRAFPLKTYSHSENRSIGVDLHFYIISAGDADKNIGYLRTIQSAVYPQTATSLGSPYTPPPVCKLRFGRLLADLDVCVVLRDYSVKYPRDVSWDETTLCPYYFQVSTRWDTVYNARDLPGQERILSIGV